MTVRSLDALGTEVPEMLVFDHTVAFVPAAAKGGRVLVLRQPAPIDYLHAVFESFWRLGTPLADPHPTTFRGDGPTREEHLVAALLAEGHSDEAIAKRLGVSMRVCDDRIRKLTRTLGGTSRTHLGVLIVRAGLDTPPPGNDTHTADGSNDV